MVDSVRVAAEMEQLDRSVFRFMTNAIFSYKQESWDAFVLDLEMTLGAARRILKLREIQAEVGR